MPNRSNPQMDFGDEFNNTVKVVGFHVEGGSSPNNMILLDGTVQEDTAGSPTPVIIPPTFTSEMYQQAQQAQPPGLETEGLLPQVPETSATSEHVLPQISEDNINPVEPLSSRPEASACAAEQNEDSPFTAFSSFAPAAQDTNSSLSAFDDAGGRDGRITGPPSMYGAALQVASSMTKATSANLGHAAAQIEGAGVTVVGFHVEGHSAPVDITLGSKDNDAQACSPTPVIIPPPFHPTNLESFTVAQSCMLSGGIADSVGRSMSGSLGMSMGTGAGSQVFDEFLPQHNNHGHFNLGAGSSGSSAVAATSSAPRKHPSTQPRVAAATATGAVTPGPTSSAPAASASSRAAQAGVVTAAERQQGQAGGPKVANGGAAGAASTAGAAGAAAAAAAVKKPQSAMTKAERRAIQEAQRAAKAAGKAVGEPAPESAGGGGKQASPASAAPGGGSGKQAAAAAAAAGGGKQAAAARGVQPSISIAADGSAAADPSRASPGAGPGGAVAAGGAAAGAKKKVPRVVSVNSTDIFSHLQQYKRVSTKTILGSSDSSSLHPSVLQLGVRYADGSISGANARCVALLHTLAQVIVDYRTPAGKTLSRDLGACMNSIVSFLVSCRPLSTSMGNAIKFLKLRISQIDPSMAESAAKEQLVQDISDFIHARITQADQHLVDTAMSKVLDGDVIMTYAYSHVVAELLLASAAAGRRFRVVCVDSRPELEGRHMMSRLLRAGIPCSYTHINALSYVIRDVSKVLLGAGAVMSNGTVLGRAGSATVAMVADMAGKPVLICCESYKFNEKVLLDSITHNELGDPEAIATVGDSASPHLRGWKEMSCLGLLNLKYDAMPAEYVTMIITEFGMIPPTSVPVILREYRQEI